MKLFIQDVITSGKDILVELLYPTSDIDINKKVIIINQKLKKYCEENNIDYLDLYNILLGVDGLINDNYTDDGLHPNEYGYMNIIEHISNKIKQKEHSQKRLS